MAGGGGGGGFLFLGTQGRGTKGLHTSERSQLQIRTYRAWAGSIRKRQKFITRSLELLLFSDSSTDRYGLNESMECTFDKSESTTSDENDDVILIY